MYEITWMQAGRLYGAFLSSEAAANRLYWNLRCKLGLQARAWSLQAGSAKLISPLLNLSF